MDADTHHGTSGHCGWTGCDGPEDGHADGPTAPHGRPPAELTVSAPVAVATAVAQAISDHDLARVTRLHHPDARISLDPPSRSVGITTWVSILGHLMTALPDFAVRTSALVGDDRMAMVEMTLTGTNTGPIVTDDWERGLLGTDLPTLPPTGRSPEVAGVAVMETVDGHIVASRLYLPPGWLYAGLDLVTVAPRPVTTPVR